MLEEGDEVDRVAPGVCLLHPLGGGELRRKRGEYRLGSLPAGDVERLERLVDEVERVPAVEVAVIGSGREEHVSQLARRCADANSRNECTFGTLGVAYVDETTEPAVQALRVHTGPGERVERHARRLHRGVGGDLGQA